MRFGEIKKVAAQRSNPAAFGVEPASGERAGDSHALVPLTPAALREPPQSYRQAPFLAQLLAIKDRHPQTRERRRAEPEEAISAYRATFDLTRFD